jgi:hypothetical protein
MPDLNFTIEAVEVTPYAAAPELTCKLRIANADRESAVQNIALQVQVRIEAMRRAYAVHEQERLGELFGEPERWSRTLRSLLWANTGVSVPAFEERCVIDLPLPCSFDFNIAATKYFHALDGGEVPLECLFSGSVFYRTAGGALQIEPIPWNREASSKLPVSVWQDMMARYYPDSAWLRVSRTVFDRLYRYKRERGLASFEQALTELLDTQREQVAS